MAKVVAIVHRKCQGIIFIGEVRNLHNPEEVGHFVRNFIDVTCPACGEQTKGDICLACEEEEEKDASDGPPLSTKRSRSFLTTDQKRAKLYLEDLQRKCYASMGIVPKTASQIIAEMRRSGTSTSVPPELKEVNWDKYFQDLEELDPPTPYTDPVFYILMQGYAQEIAESLRGFSLSVQKYPIISTLPTGRINAMVIRVPLTDEYVIAYEVSLCLFAGSMSALVAECCDPVDKIGTKQRMYRIPENPEEVQKHLSDNPALLQHFQGVLFSYLVKGNIVESEYYPISEGSLSLKHVFVSNMERFIVGHEYAHIALGHLKEEVLVNSVIVGETVDEVCPEWNQEIEADSLGLRLMLATSKDDPSLSFIGADLFFTCIDTIERAVATMRSGDEHNRVFTTHPPPTERRAVLRKVLEAHIGQRRSSGAIEVANAAQWVIDGLWKEARSGVFDLRRRGQKLAKLWEW